MKWIIYYTDFPKLQIESITHEQCKPEEVPGFGIIGIAVEDPIVGWALIRSYDRYVYDDDLGWCGMDRIGWIDYVGHSRRPVIVKFGRNIPSQLWKQFITEWGLKKQNYLPGEKR